MKLTHPHNANDGTYDAAIAAVALIRAEAKRLDDVACTICFDTIETSHARHDAIALHRAVQTLRDAADAAYAAAVEAHAAAHARAVTLAKVEGRIA